MTKASKSKITKGLVLVTSIPAPYHIQQWNRLADLTKGNLVVCFHWQSHAKRWWRVPVEEMNFEWRTLSRATPEGFLAQIQACGAILALLFRRRPWAVICGGYDSLACWATLAWCKVFRRRLVLWCDSNARDQRPRSTVRTWLKRIFVSNSGAFAVLGTAGFEYVKQLGAGEEDVFVVPFGGDSEFFAREAQAVDGVSEKTLNGWPRRLILFSGRLVREKGVYVLLEAFGQISSRNTDVGLLIVGDGPAQQDMVDFCRRESLERVYFVGPQQYKHMPYYYSLADVLVLPTFSDTYGFVVIEAFACGVPAIVTRVAGVCDDAIFEGETGFAVNPGDATELAQKIALLLEDEGLRASMSANCRLLSRKFSPDACAQALFGAAFPRCDAQTNVLAAAPDQSQHEVKNGSWNL